jgi:hypothetical protein
LTTWKTPPATGVSEACQNSGAEASPDRQRIGSPAQGLISLISLFAHFYLANLLTPGKMIKAIA